MKPVTSFSSGLELNTDRIAAASKQRRADRPAATTDSSREPAQQARAFRREIPMPDNAGFVDVDGKRYFLNAPRGTYVNIVV